MKASRQAILSLAVLLAAGLFFRFMAKSAPGVARAEGERIPPLVSSLEITPGAATIVVEGFGAATPLARTEIRARVAGEAIFLHEALDRGGRVNAGDTLLRLDPADARLRVENARAQAEAREAALARVRLEAENHAALLAFERENLDLAEADLARNARLFAARTISRAAYDRVLLAAQKARSAARALENALALARAQESTEAANLRLARVSVEQAELDLSRCEIVAPLSGAVERRTVDAHQFVAVGAPLCTIVDPARLEVAVDLSAADFDALFPAGVPDPLAFAGTVEVRRADRPAAAAAPARLVRVAEQLKPTTRTRAIYLELDGPAAGLVPGDFCRVRIGGPTLADIRRIPFAALRDGRVQAIRDGRITLVPVERVRDLGDEIWVRGDLRTPERIVRTYQESLRENDPARDRPAAEGPSS